MAKLFPTLADLPRFHRWDVPFQRRFWQDLTPPQLLITSFLLLILAGTLGYKVLPGLYTGPSLSWLDALFTATSAVCVTGLVVVDTATYFTFWGQLYTLLLIQLGGLGIIAFTSLIIIAVGQRLSLRSEAVAATGYEAAPMVDRSKLIRDVVIFTVFIEAAGATLLYLLWVPSQGWTGAFWPAIFHAVSAFCNAGFSTFSDSLTRFHNDPFTLLVIMALIIAGGLGFLTLEELYLHRRYIKENRAFRLSLHSRIVLVSSAVLILAPWPLFVSFEWFQSFKDMPLLARITNGLFMSVTPRTAGFNTIDYAQATDSSNFLTIILMSIGGSPGSTAGGVKTTTIALMGLLAYARFTGTEVISIAGRSVREETLQRAVGLFVVAFGVVTVAIFVLTASEGLAGGTGRFLQHMFECASAFNTVGLSMGLTDKLTPMGKWTDIALMFLGRVGPLTLAAALAVRRPPPGAHFRYAYEDVVVG